MKEIEIILYVAELEKSKVFYGTLLQQEPSLDVSGMTEFSLTASVKLGLMPERGIAKIISPRMPHPKEGNGIPRCELYLKTGNAARYLARGIELGGVLIDPMQERDWGDTVGYIADPDGHILAFAEV